MSSTSLDKMRQKLCDLGQEHLFAQWSCDPSATNEEEKQKQAAFLQTFIEFEQQYPGGISAYITNARTLLQHGGCEAVKKITTTPSIPALTHYVPTTKEHSAEWIKMEAEGLQIAKQTLFVLVAGGLGERLGYQGIKLSLPIETASGRSYLEHYCTWLRTVAANAPLVIMTSDDTHTKTKAVLDANANFGLKHVHLLRQGTVPCLGDLNAALATANPFTLLRKPHGHGDIHTLLHKSGLIEELLHQQQHQQQQAISIKYIAFVQDTNASSVTTLPYSLAVSKAQGLTMNFTCIGRRPGEAVGALCDVKCVDGKTRVVNIEYNVLDGLLQQQHQKNTTKDEAAEQEDLGSKLPGSINTLIVDFRTYTDLICKTHGVVPELINPKFKDATKTTFKTPTRVESLMQDIAWYFSVEDKHRIGGTVFERALYHPVKNSVADALSKLKGGLDAHGALSGEAAIYNQHRLRMKSIGVRVEEGAASDKLFIPSTVLFPVVSLPSNCFSTSHVSILFPTPEKVSISPRSVLVITGSGDVVIEELVLDGALTIDATTTTATKNPTNIAGGATRVVVRHLTVRNAGWEVHPVDPAASPETSTTTRGEDPVTIMRGFRFDKKETKVIKFDDGMEHVLDERHAKM